MVEAAKIPQMKCKKRVDASAPVIKARRGSALGVRLAHNCGG